MRLFSRNWPRMKRLAELSAISKSVLETTFTFKRRKKQRWLRRLLKPKGNVKFVRNSRPLRISSSDLRLSAPQKRNAWRTSLNKS